MRATNLNEAVKRNRFFLELKTELIREIMLSITLKLLVKLLYLYWIYK